MKPKLHSKRKRQINEIENAVWHQFLASRTRCAYMRASCIAVDVLVCSISLPRYALDYSLIVKKEIEKEKYFRVYCFTFVTRLLNKVTVFLWHAVQW